MSDEDAKTIRVALLGLIKYYVFREITFEELNQILCFVVTVEDENMVRVLKLTLGVNSSCTRWRDQYI